MLGNDSDLTFRVEEWTADGEKYFMTFAACRRFDHAELVYGAVMEQTNGQPRVIMIRQGIRVVKRSDREG